MTYILKVCVLSLLLLVVPAVFIYGQNPSLNKTTLYTAMAGHEVNEVNELLSTLDENATGETSAYAGALLMKKAGLVGKPKDKLRFFRSGRTKLETAIKEDNNNIEYHFLRLIIQENSPRIVKYKSDLKTDAELVRKSFKKLPSVVQQAVRDYSKNSHYLSAADFN